MTSAKKKTYKNGFSVFELVIVIAIIAILAAVLIPTFKSIINNAERSKDKAVVSNMNKSLAIETIPYQKHLSFDEVKTILNNGGYDIPYPASAKTTTIYWVPGEQKIVLYGITEDAVIFPQDCSTYVKTDDWIDISSSDLPETGDTPGTDDDTEDNPEEDAGKTFTLISGGQFNSAVKSICSSPSGIIFGNKSDYASINDDNPVSLSSDGKIKGYKDGNKVYVLSYGNIQLPANASGMFSSMSSLTSVNFGSITTSLTTNMQNMFSGCSSLSELNLTGFNTSSVTNTAGMFTNCGNLKKIHVTTSSSKWNMSKVTSSNDMFAYCKNLPNYNFSDKHDGIWSFLSSIYESVFNKNPDVSYAHTSSGGYLTEG